MDGVRLKLNPEKTEFIIISDRQARESIMQKFPTQFLGNSISPTNEVKNLGVTFDSGNTFASHITKVCRACYYHLKDLIHKFLSVETAALLANSMISSRIDYCNSLLYGVNKNTMWLNSKRFKMPSAELFSDLIKLAMLLPICKNYTGSPFHTISCSNIILLHSRLSNSPNPHIYHP